MSARRRRVALTVGAVAVFVVSAALYAPTLARPLGNGDEAVYAEMAREMAATHDFWTLRWQGAPCLYRPPASVWPLALAVAVAGPSETAVRAPVALQTALAGALVFLLGARRRRVAVGLAAAVLFACARLTLRYAAYIESEPLLIDWFLGAWLAWEHTGTAAPGEPGSARPAQEQSRAWLVFGACVGGALFVKPIVGGLPLVLLALRRPPPRRLAALLALAAAPSLPWIAYQWAQHGRAFVDAFFVANLLGRSLHPMLRGSTPLYYPLMLWRTEGPLVLLFAVGVGHAAWRRDWAPLIWAAAVLLPFSLVASRYDYYALPAYPALALVTAAALVDVRRALAPIAVMLWALVHLPVIAWRGDVSDPESGALARVAGARMGADEVLFVVDQVPYSARWYAGRRTVQIVFDAREQEETRRMLPAEVMLDGRETWPARLAAQPGWAIVPKVYAGALGPPLEVVADEGPYLLVRRR
jgi:4-amino-4-deoxy-L-arabinose transferase-like glycosyltransferase